MAQWGTMLSDRSAALLRTAKLSPPKAQPQEGNSFPNFDFGDEEHATRAIPILWRYAVPERLDRSGGQRSSPSPPRQH
jgi:hypothetical protein